LGDYIGWYNNSASDGSSWTFEEFMSVKDWSTIVNSIDLDKKYSVLENNASSGNATAGRLWYYINSDQFE
jgi:hypothetical protein